MGTLGLILASVIMSIASVGYAETVRAVGNKVNDRLVKTANNIYTKIANNNQLLDKISEAYNTKNNNLLQDIFTSAGFGPRIDALQKELESTKKDYQTQKHTIENENVQLQNQYNELASAQAGLGTIAGNQYADSKLPKEDAGVNQNIKGGLIL